MSWPQRDFAVVGRVPSSMRLSCFLYLKRILFVKLRLFIQILSTCVRIYIPFTFINEGKCQLSSLLHWNSVGALLGSVLTSVKSDIFNFNQSSKFEV